MPTGKFKIVEIKSDVQEGANVHTAQLVLESEDGFVLNCDSDFPNEPIGDTLKEELTKYTSTFLNGNLVFVAFADSLKKVENADRKLEQKEGTYETEICGEVVKVEEHEDHLHFDVDTGKFTFALESKKSAFHPKEGEHVGATGDLRIEDIELL